MHTSRSKCPVTGHDVFCSNSFSIDLPDVVPDLYDSTGRVRGAIQLTGYIFRPFPATPEDGRLQMAFVGQCDPKGLLPATIVNFASVSQALNVGRVRDSYQHFRQVVGDFKVPHHVPLECFSLPRRGGSVTHRIPIVQTSESKEGYIRLLVHCDLSITAQATENTNGCAVQSVASADSKDKEKFADGQPTTFGGKGDLVLDMVLQVTLKDQAYLEITFSNHCWKKATLCCPESMELSATAASLDQTTALEATEQ